MGTRSRTLHVPTTARIERSQIGQQPMLDHLRAEVIGIEVLTRAAEAATDALRTPTSDRQHVL